MKTVPISIVGPSEPSRSKQYSVQSTVNLYPEINKNGRYPAALMCWPGLVQFGTTYNTDIDRGMHVFKNVLYKVSGTTLFAIDDVGAYTTIGTVSGTARCVFADDGYVMAIVAGGLVYQYDGTTFAQITDPDLQTPNAVAFLNNQWIYDGDGGTFVTSDVGDPSSIDPFNYASAEALGDDLIRPYTFNQVLYLMGERSIESWYNSGVGSPPFDRIEGGIIQKGIAGVYCVTNTDQFTYFMSDDKSMYKLSGYQVQNVTTPSVAHAFETYETVADCVMFSIRMEGQDFILLKFPTADKSWCYSETTDFWFELSSGTQGGNHVATSYVYCYGKHLVAVKGSVYEWDLFTYTDLGEPQIKQRILGPINGSMFEMPGQRLMMNRFQLFMQTGVGLSEGNGSNPTVMLSLSPDGGETWGQEYQVDIGQMGRYQTKVEWYHIESFYDGVIKIRFSDPVFVSIHSAAIDIDSAGY